MESEEIRGIIAKYFGSTAECLSVLSEMKHIGQALVIAYSAVDTLGLLDAPATTTASSGESFKAWARTYLLTQPGISFSDIDLWAARCAVLHTSTSESDLSRKGRARELVYFNGDSAHPIAIDFVERTKRIENGRYLAVSLKDLFVGVISAMKAFAPILQAKCEADPVVAVRLRKVLQLHAWPPPNSSLKRTNQSLRD